MNRKKFLSSIAGAGLAIPILGKSISISDEDIDLPISIPKYLKQGDTIGITCPAGFITSKDIQPAVLQMQSWGFNVRVGSTVDKKDFTFGGTDAERTSDFQQMLDDPNIKAIMCARGGYGSVRIIDQLDFSKFSKHPKWIIGFSDITVIHSHINRNFRAGSIHSKMCNSFPDDPSKTEPKQMDSILSIKQALVGETMQYKVDINPNNKLGIGKGELVGGNLKTLESLSGSKSDIKTDNKILFVEDTGEYLYSIDRMFWNLKRTNKLSKLKGLIIGGFKAKPDDPGEDFGRTLYEIVLGKVKEYSYPVCFDFPVGHQKVNYALKCGVHHQLNVSNNECSLTEIIKPA